MRLMFRSAFLCLCAPLVWAVSLATFVGDVVVMIGSYFLEALATAWRFIPRLDELATPVRRIWMVATALNGRHVGGVRIHGFLGRPAVRMLTG